MLGSLCSSLPMRALLIYPSVGSGEVELKKKERRKIERTGSQDIAGEESACKDTYFDPNPYPDLEPFAKDKTPQSWDIQVSFGC